MSESLSHRLGAEAEIHFEVGSVSRLGDVLGDSARVLVVRGRKSFERCGAATAVAAIRGQFKIEEFADLRPNPTVEDVAAGLDVARRFDADTVVGIGGGSVLDLAKSIALLADTNGDPIEYLRGERTPSRRCRLVLVPTTCGSGSELTQFATLYAGGWKYSLDFPDGGADVALIDPNLAASVPSAVAASARADALSHAVESYWSVLATDESRALAREAMTMLMPDGGVEQFALGAALAGAAINMTRTTAAHALSYALTTELGIPHGMAVALHMTWLIDHNAEVSEVDCRHPGGPDTVRSLIADARRLCHDVTGVDLPDLYRDLLTQGGQPLALNDLPIADRCEVWRAALGSPRGGNNPRVVLAEDVEWRQHG